MMRRLTVFSLALLLGLLMAAPALAQGRDPFEPNEGQGQGQEAEDDSSGDDPFDPAEGGGTQDPAPQDPDDPTDPVEQPTTDPAPAPDDEVSSGTLANTGLDVTSWGAVAYLLIVVGAAAIVAGRTFAPVPLRRRK